MQRRRFGWRVSARGSSADPSKTSRATEDVTRDAGHSIYDFQHAVERVAAAVEAARALSFPFVLVARAEGLRFGRDFDDVLRRLQAFEAAGADVLFAPGLTNAERIRTVCTSVSKPVNVVIGVGRMRDGTPYSVAGLAALGVRRISLGGGLSRVAIGALSRAAREIHEHGTFTYADGAVSSAELEHLLALDSGAR